MSILKHPLALPVLPPRAVGGRVPPPRRSPLLLYIYMIGMGLISGFVPTTPPFRSLLGLPDACDPVVLALSAVLAAIGCSVGASAAHALQERYIRALNAWPWLLSSCALLVICPLLCLVVVAAISIVVGGFLFIAGLAGVLYAIYYYASRR